MTGHRSIQCSNGAPPRTCEDELRFERSFLMTWDETLALSDDDLFAELEALEALRELELEGEPLGVEQSRSGLILKGFRSRANATKRFMSQLLDPIVGIIDSPVLRLASYAIFFFLGSLVTQGLSDESIEYDRFSAALPEAAVYSPSALNELLNSSDPLGSRTSIGTSSGGTLATASSQSTASPLGDTPAAQGTTNRGHNAVGVAEDSFVWQFRDESAIRIGFQEGGLTFPAEISEVPQLWSTRFGGRFYLAEPSFRGFNLTPGGSTSANEASLRRAISGSAGQSDVNYRMVLNYGCFSEGGDSCLYAPSTSSSLVHFVPFDPQGGSLTRVTARLLESPDQLTSSGFGFRVGIRVNWDDAQSADFNNFAYYVGALDTERLEVAKQTVMAELRRGDGSEVSPRVSTFAIEQENEAPAHQELDIDETEASMDPTSPEKLIVSPF